MAFERVCSVDEIWEGDMVGFEVGDVDVLLLWPVGGELRAVQGVCPHQEIALAEGTFDGKVLTCRAHLWQFDARTGKGINPTDCELAAYPVKVENDEVWVDVSAVHPKSAAI